MIEGPVSLLAGMRLMLAKPELRSLLWRMLGLLLLLMMLLMGGTFWLAGLLAMEWIPEGDAWYLQLAAFFIWVIAFLLAAVTGIVSFTALGSAAVAPWLDAMAARTERLSGFKGEENEAPWATQMLQSLANTVRPLLGLLAFGALAIAVMIIPFIGPFAATLIWGYAGIRFLNYELMDTVAGRRGWDFQRRKQEQGRRRFFYLGFGAMALALMAVPLVNLLVLPAAVVALSRQQTEAG